MKGRTGLGFEKTASSEKEKLKELVGQISEQDLLLTLVDKRVQGRFRTWENTMQLDIGWNNLIFNYKMSPAPSHVFGARGLFGHTGSPNVNCMCFARVQVQVTATSLEVGLRQHFAVI